MTDEQFQQKLELRLHDFTELSNDIYEQRLLALLDECRAAGLTDEQSLGLREEVAEEMRDWREQQLRIVSEVVRDGEALN